MAATPTSVLVLGLPLDVDDDSANKTIARHFKHPMISSGSRIQFVTRIPDEVAGNIQSEGTKIFLVKFSSAHQALQCDPNLHVLQFDTGLEIKVTVQQCTDEIEQFISTQLTGQQEEVNSRRPHTPVPIPQVQLLSQQDEANSKRPHTPVPIPQVQLTSVNENAPSSGNIHAAGQHHEMQPEDGNPHALHDNPQGSSFYSVQGPQTQVMHEMQQSAWGQPRQMTGHNPGMNHWYMSQRGPMSFQYPQGYQDWYSNWQGYGIRPPQQEWGPYYQQMQGVPPLQPQHYVRHPSNEIFYDHRTNQPYPGVGACQNVTRSPPNTGMTSLTRVDPSIQSKLGRIKPPVPPKPSEIKSQADTTDSEVDPVIKVSGFKRETSTDLLELYFESKKRSGGGPMKSIEMKDDSVHIVFEKSKDAHRFLKQNHALEGAKLTVQVLNTPVVGDVDIGMASQPEDKDYLDSAIIDVTGFGSDVNMETVELYLENKRRSGGGPILEKFQDRKGVLTIVYENAAIAERVLKRPMHTVGGISLTVAKGRKRRKVVTDNKCILIKGFSDETTKEDLVLYLENRSGIEEEPVLLFGEKPGVVMARYSQNISDVNKAVTAINSRPLKRSVLTAEPVLVTSTIIASNLPPNVSEDILELYFESKRNGEGDVEEIKLDVEKKLAIISFQDSEAIDQILQRKSHTIHKQLITVNPYYEFLGVMVSSDGPIPQQPNPISKDVNQDITVYIMNRGEYATELRNQLNDLHTKIEWPYGGHNNMVCLSSNIPDHLENKRQFIKDWPKKVVSILDEHLNKFKCITKSIPKDIWNQVIGQTEELDIGDSSVEYISESMELKITGTLENVDNLETQFKNVITDIEEKLRKANETITETREIKKVQMQQLIMVQFNETVAQQFPELNFHLSVDESQLHFIGLPHDIMSCRILLYETLGALPVAKLEPPNPFYVEFLNSADVSAILHSMLNDKDLRAMYLIADNEIVVSARDKPQLKQAVNIIHTSITDVNITVDDESLPGIHQQDWEKLVVELEEQNVCRIRTDLEGQCITIITFQSTIKCIRKEVDHYIKVNTIVEYNIQSDRGRIRFAFDHKKDDVVSLETGKYQPLKINKCLESLVINIKGTKDDVESARERMTNLLDVIQIRQYVIDKPGMSKLFREEKGKNYIQSVEKAFACKIEINDPSPRKLDRVAGKTTRKSLVPGYRMLCQHTKPNGMKIQVGLGDMTVLNVDVIVNAANCHLKHVGGLAKAIIDAGGLEIQDECDKIIERRGDLKVGETVSTGAGNLPCKLIIHTVGPIWSGSKYKKSGSNETQEEKSLTNSVINSLQEATSRKCTTIAIPAISSGVFGFPVDLCVHTIVKAVDSFCELNQNHSLKEIRLVDNSVITCDQFKDAMIDMYGKDSMSYGVDTFPGILTIPKMDKVETSRMKTKVPSGGFIPTTLAFEVTTVEGKTIKLIKGNISAQKADIIVNTTFATLDLNCAVSKAILLAAGNNLQKEIDALKADGTKRKNGDIVITAGAQLSCKKVYHIICDKWTGDQFLRNVLQKCLMKAHQSGMTSIAFPAIGTGGRKFPRDVTAKIMYEEVKTFSTKYSTSSLNTISFVVYDKDQPTIKAFEQECNNITTTKEEEPSKTRHRRKIVESPLATETTSTNMGNEFTDLKKGTSEWHMKVGPIFIDVLQGDIITEATEAIVNSTTVDLDLSWGVISKAVLAAAGTTIQDECKQLGKQSEDTVVITNAGKLKCKKIVHMVTPYPSLQHSIKKMLVFADQKGLTSISIPAIGTGGLGLSPKDGATKTFSAIKDFKQTNPKNMKRIRLVIFQAQMLSVYHDVMAEMAVTSPELAKETVEATSDIKGTPSKDNMFGSIRVDVVQGDITSESTDAIVNNTNSEMNMTWGVVSKAILAAGGKSIQDECQTLGEQQDDTVVITNAGKLQCRKIIHMVVPYKDLKTSIINMLQYAEQNGLKSIAMPAIGTGGLGISAKQAAKTTFEAVQDFQLQYNPQSLNYIRLAIFQQAMVAEYQQVMNSIVQSYKGPTSTRGALRRMISGFGYMFGSGKTHVRKKTYLPTKTERAGDSGKDTKWDNITLDIYAESGDVIDHAIKKIEEQLQGEYREKSIRDANVKDLTSEDMLHLQTYAEGLQVKIERVIDDALTELRIYGSLQDVVAVQEETTAILDKIKERKLREERDERYEHNLKHLAKTVKWLYEDNNSDFVEYDEIITGIIESAYLDTKDVVEFQDGSRTYRLDFKTMSEVDISDNSSVSVRRQLKAAGVSLPHNWAGMNDKDIFIAVDVDRTSTEFKTVESYFKKSLQNYKLKQTVKIERIQNPRLYRSYAVLKQSVELKNPKGSQIERKLFHGTSADTILEINTAGFNRSFAGKNATAYGKGTYFAVNSGYSTSYAAAEAGGNKYMYQAAVITGEYTQGNGKMIVPPARTKNDKYDSVVDNMQNPDMFVVFNDAMAYPEYLITFQ